MKNITSPVAIRMFNNILEYIPTTESGTYNQADPTHFEKGRLTTPFEGKNYRLLFFDNSWGLEFKVQVQVGSYMSQAFKQVGDIYIEPKELTPRDNWKKGNLILCAKLLKHLRDTRAVNYAQLRPCDEGEDLGYPNGYM